MNFQHKKFVERTKLMKSDYENDISELKEIIENLKTAKVSTDGGDDVSNQIKKIMSGFYKKVKKEFNGEESYKGNLINNIILESIKVWKSYWPFRQFYDSNLNTIDINIFKKSKN